MNPYLEQLRARWAALADRERRVVALGAAALALTLAYLLVWEPVVGARAAREAQLAEQRAIAVLLETLAVEAQRGRGGAVTLGASQSLLAVVDQSRKTSGITKPPSRLQPEGDTAVRIWLDDVPFDALLRWLNDLQTRYGVRVDTADIERESGAGLVNARLTLMR